MTKYYKQLSRWQKSKKKVKLKKTLIRNNKENENFINIYTINDIEALGSIWIIQYMNDDLTFIDTTIQGFIR